MWPNGACREDLAVVLESASARIWCLPVRSEGAEVSMLDKEVMEEIEAILHYLCPSKCSSRSPRSQTPNSCSTIFVRVHTHGRQSPTSRALDPHRRLPRC